MTLLKKAKDNIIKFTLGKSVVPRGLYDINQYFRHHNSIKFDYKKEGNSIVGISNNFRYGSIITSGRNQRELDKNIKDAILTSFDIPSSYAKEVGLHKVGDKQKTYALA